MNDAAQLPTPWHNPWPSDGLETVCNCPVCGNERRDLLYENLVDNVFRVAPGTWQLWKCARCGSAYLDPRPTPDSIHLAYGSYYTHREPGSQDDYEILSPLRKLRRHFVNGYTNWRYSTQFQPANVFGVAAAFAVPTLRRVIDRHYRHLPRRPETGGCILDVGSGDGYFLRLAHSCGWDVMGVDPDPKASSLSQGFPVCRGGVDCLDAESELFDVVTLNHVIEHVPDPVTVLNRCHALLKPGGQIWLETPNIDGFGHERYGRNWRGLEPPRHLVIFNESSIETALRQVGFTKFAHRPRPLPHLNVFKESKRLELSQAANSGITLLYGERWAARWAALKAHFRRSRREFLTLTAEK